MDKFARMALLYDFYGPLLTTKQRDSLDLYYQQDLSLTEIAGEEGISRQAVHDLLKRTEKILLEYEEKLGLVDRYLEQHARLTEMDDLLSQIPDMNTPVVNRLRQVIKELLAKE
ncbi:MAG TPA: YlxM family DNA-binding protein [Verrucomicrobiae bacterium]|nr:YlxM family DNA-binding protein [Verrucomicrobiae bacterium]